MAAQAPSQALAAPLALTTSLPEVVPTAALLEQLGWKKFASTLLFTSVAALLISAAAFAREPTPQLANAATVRAQIVQESVASYLSTGRPCACPYNTMRNGAACGGRSAYSRAGGAAPLCYPHDVTDTIVSLYRRSAW